MKESYIIVGGGNFGWAAALELRSRYPSLDVTLIDEGSSSQEPSSNPRAASHDKSKIVRPDYADPFYTKLMLEAMPKWKTCHLYSQWFHETGMIRADDGTFNDGCLAAFSYLGATSPSCYISVEEAHTMWNGVIKHAKFDGIDKCYYNPAAGWAEAEGALNAVIRQACGIGVKYDPSGAHHLIIESGRCSGVVLKNGGRLHADTVLLCTGARTAKLLADSAPTDSSIHVGKRLTATGAVCYAAVLEESSWKQYAGGPVVKNGLHHTTGEVMPLHERSGTLKSNLELCFSHKELHEPSQQEISVPPGVVSESSWCAEVPEELKSKARQVVLNTYGPGILHCVKTESWRMCWDVSTPSHDFLITPHPSCSDLYLATGGSFHGWKFLPVIGKYIVHMLEGNLNEEQVRRWSWDSQSIVKGNGEKANHTYEIKQDLKDFAGWKALEIHRC